MLKKKKRISKGRGRGRERAYVTTFKLVQMTISEMAFSAARMYSSGAGNPTIRFDHIFLKNNSKSLIN